MKKRSPLFCLSANALFEFFLVEHFLNGSPTRKSPFPSLFRHVCKQGLFEVTGADCQVVFLNNPTYWSDGRMIVHKHIVSECRVGLTQYLADFSEVA